MIGIVGIAMLVIMLPFAWIFPVDTIALTNKTGPSLLNPVDQVEETATRTARVAHSTDPILDRLTAKKPGLWGTKVYYIGLFAIYGACLVFFIIVIAQRVQN